MFSFAQNPEGIKGSSRSCEPFDRVILAAAIGATSLLVLSLAFPVLRDKFRSPEQSQNGPAAPNCRTLLVPSVYRLKFGKLAQGGRSEIAFSLHNPGRSPVSVTRVETSCDCFEIHLAQTVVAPGGTISATGIVDFSGKPDFAGGLLLHSRGRSEANALDAFVLQGDVEVQCFGHTRGTEGIRYERPRTTKPDRLRLAER